MKMERLIEETRVRPQRRISLAPTVAKTPRHLAFYLWRWKNKMIERFPETAQDRNLTWSPTLLKIIAGDTELAKKLAVEFRFGRGIAIPGHAGEVESYGVDWTPDRIAFAISAYHYPYLGMSVVADAIQHAAFDQKITREVMRILLSAAGIPWLSRRLPDDYDEALYGPSPTLFKLDEFSYAIEPSGHISFWAGTPPGQWFQDNKYPINILLGGAWQILVYPSEIAWILKDKLRFSAWLTVMSRWGPTLTVPRHTPPIYSKEEWEATLGFVKARYEELEAYSAQAGIPYATWRPWPLYLRFQDLWDAAFPSAHAFWVTQVIKSEGQVLNWTGRQLAEAYAPLLYDYVGTQMNPHRLADSFKARRYYIPFLKHHLDVSKLEERFKA